MPRPGDISKAVAMEVLQSFISHFQDPDSSKWPPLSSEVYQQMSKKLDGKWTFLTWYLTIRQDRRNIHSEVRKLLNLPDVIKRTRTRKSRPDVATTRDDSFTFENYKDIDGTRNMDNDAFKIVYDLFKLVFMQPYVGSIQEVTLLPFHASYSTPMQLEKYKKFHTMNKVSAEISIDATGSLVKKLVWKDGRESDHVFLYSVVINVDDTLQSVYQFLTERHDSRTLTDWLNIWPGFKTQKPKTVVCSYSRGLLCGCMWSFNGPTLKTYLRDSFARAISNDDNIPLPSTFIRVGISHLIRKVCSWTSVNYHWHARVQDFYIRCVILLANCQSVDEFRKLSVLVCAIAANPFHDSIVQLNSIKMVVNEVRIELEKLISEMQQTDEILDISFKKILKSSANIIKPIDSKEEGGPENIDQFIAGIMREAKQNPMIVGIEYNFFYSKNLVEELEQLLKDFPLWTAATLPYVADYAMAYNHLVFDDIQYRILGKSTKKVNVNELVKLHLDDLLRKSPAQPMEDTFKF